MSRSEGETDLACIEWRTKPEAGLSCAAAQAATVGALVEEATAAQRDVRSGEVVLTRHDGLRASASELAWLGALIDAIPDYVLLINEKHTILMINAAVRRDAQDKEAHLVGGYCPRVIHDRAAPFPGCPLREAVEKGTRTENELFDPRTNSWMRAVICPTPFRDNQGLAVFLHLVGDITKRKKLEALRTELIDKVITSQDEERRRVARELHDETAQALASVNLRLRKLETAGDGECRREQLIELRSSVEAAAERLRRLARGLHPSLLDDLGLDAALERCVTDFVETSQIEVDLHVAGFDGSSRRLPHAVEMSLYRITQEALTNIARHSEATRASVVLDRQPIRLQLIIEDNGRGFDPDAPTEPAALGLTSIRERVSLLTGRLEIESRPDGGTTLYVEVPLVEETP